MGLRDDGVGAGCRGREEGPVWVTPCSGFGWEMGMKKMTGRPQKKGSPEGRVRAPRGAAQAGAGGGACDSEKWFSH